MTELQAIKGSIKHWEDMIEWVKKQPSNEKPCEDKMQFAIRQDWFDVSCPLCQFLCSKCPLGKKYGECVFDPKNAWGKVNNSKTWAEWLINARKMLRQLKSLLPRRKK